MKKYFLILSPLILFYFVVNGIKPKVLSEPNAVRWKEKDSLIIYGKVRDNLGELFNYAKIKIQNSKQIINVEENGTYKINVIDLLNKKDELIIEFSFLGYKTEKRKIKRDLFDENNTLEMNIKLKELPIVIECLKIYP